MKRSFASFPIMLLAFVLMIGAIVQPGHESATAETAGIDPGIVHHLDTSSQPDHWEARQPGIATDRDLQLVIGTDTRTRVTPTTTHPHRSIAYMEAWDDEQEMGFSCTATFIGPRVLLTAAHCLWIDEFGGFADRVVVAAGKDGEHNPYGYEFASSVWVPNGWANTTGSSMQRFQWDFGLILLPNSTMGDTVGALEIGVLGDATLKSSDFNPTTAGYPGDKPPATQWISSMPSFDRVTANHLVNSIDAFQGQSGSAIWGAADGRIVGVVSFETRTTNYAVRISGRVIDSLTFGCNVLVHCTIDYSTEGEEPEPPATPEPTLPVDPITPPVDPTPLPPQPTPTPEPPAVNPFWFDQVWQRTDHPVEAGTVDRTWIWGPGEMTTPMFEPYLESPGGERAVVYYDKSRMEITNPGSDPGSDWYVTNGLLVVEMITGNLQVGNDTFIQHQPAEVNVAGDPNDPTSPTYATFGKITDHGTIAEGAAITNRLSRDGTVTDDPTLAARGITAARHVDTTGYSVASVFWEFMNEQGIVYEHDGFTIGPLFLNPFYATGLPISDPYWTTVHVAGTEHEVLVQAFERRILTYTPSNPAGWQVEAGNVGQHYFTWRYEQIVGE